MKTLPPSAFARFATLAFGITFPAFLVSLAQGQTTGFNQTASGTYIYDDSANWVDGDINGIWDPTLTLAGNQTLTFAANTSISTDLSFRYAGNADTTFRGTGGNFTLTLQGDILHQTAANRTITIGSTSANQNLNVDLDGAVRTFTVYGGGNGGTFGRTLSFVNSVSNGGVIASGGGSGGGLIRFAGASNTLDSLKISGADVSAHGAANTGVNTATTITGALTAGTGTGSVTLTTAALRNTLVQAGTFSREAGSTLLFRGTNLGVNSIASATANSSNVQFLSAPSLRGSGPAGTSTVGILAGAFGDTSATGSGFGATGGLVTYDADKGVRLLDASEYTSSITDGQTQLDNVKLANSSGTVATTTLSTTTTINSLSMEVTGTPGNQGITITESMASTLKIDSGVIYAYQNVSSNPTSSDAMTISVSTLDLNGQEGIILANTRMNSSGGISNGGLFINSTITNANGLTIGDGIAGSASGFVHLGGSEANTYTGPTTINGAAVRLGKSVANTFGDIVLNLGAVMNSGNQIADSANLTINGGTFYLNSTSNSGSATSETLNNLTMTYGTVSAGSGHSNTFKVNGDANLSGGSINMARNAKLEIAGTTTLSGGVISVGTNDSTTVYNSRTTLGTVNITNTAKGTSPYTPITIAAGNAIDRLGGHLELTGDLTFAGNLNTNTVTIAAPTGSGLQGVMALRGTRTFDIGDGAASHDLTIDAPLIDGSLDGDPVIGGLTKTGAGTLALTGVNTYSGNTTVSVGALTLAETGSLTFYIGANGVNNRVTGSGTVTFNGTFNFDLSGADATVGNSWTIVDVNTLNESFTGTFMAQGFTENSGVWTFGDYTFNESTGLLTYGAVPEPATYALLAGAGLLGFAVLRRKRRDS